MASGRWPKFRRRRRRRHAALDDRERARGRVVFRAFDAAVEGAGAARDDPLHELRRRAESRRNFARIEHAQAVRSCPLADVEKGARLFQRRRLPR